LAKKNFAKQIAEAVEGTHYSVDHICGIGCQETVYFWLRMIDKISVEDVARDVFSTRAEMRRIPPARLFPATRKRSEKNMETNELTH